MPSERPIYAASIFALLHDVFQINESRGRLCFQEREDDVGIDTSTNITRHIFQVISIDNYMILYFITRDKNTTPNYFFRRIIEGICKINIKMRDSALDVYTGHTSAPMHMQPRDCSCTCMREKGARRSQPGMLRCPCTSRWGHTCCQPKETSISAEACRRWTPYILRSVNQDTRRPLLLINS